MVKELIVPVVLSGGSGTRLWPLSRKLFPKQLLPLISDKSMLQETLCRLDGLKQSLLSPIVVCNEEHRFLVAEQLKGIGKENSTVILEPIGRNTAPALTLAALALEESQRNAVMLIMPADHIIQDEKSFHIAISQATLLAAEDFLVTFGVVPDRPECGYGYIRKGETISKLAGSHDTEADKLPHFVELFVEKPDPVTAARYVASKNYFWNSGMFMMKVSVWLDALGKFRPDILESCRQAYQHGERDRDFYRAAADLFEVCPEESIDYAVMEKIVRQDGPSSYKTVVVPLVAGWSDVGAWGSLWEMQRTKDDQNNVTKGDILLENTSNSLLYASNRLVAAVGVEDLVIVETADAVLVAHRDASQDVKAVVERIHTAGRKEHLVHRRVHRPWGSYEGIDTGDRYQVKRITVNPGAALSLQMHHHRAEHWIVVKGTARVIRGKEEILLTENQSTYIPLGTVHRLENPGTIPLEMIEVQSGSYLGEDDIVRFEDDYGR